MEFSSFRQGAVLPRLAHPANYPTSHTTLSPTHPPTRPTASPPLARRELWYRASLAWQLILGSDQLSQRGLVVAHNAVNQALICTALGLPPAFFRRLTQVRPGHAYALRAPCVWVLPVRLPWSCGRSGCGVVAAFGLGAGLQGEEDWGIRNGSSAGLLAAIPCWCHNRQRLGMLHVPGGQGGTAQQHAPRGSASVWFSRLLVRPAGSLSSRAT